MKLSACYIVKDAAPELERSLQSLREAVDEIIVIDTGSMDSTIEIAMESGAEIYSYAWQDDFAEARNFALSKATGDWIIFLDADEFFSPETNINLRQVIETYADSNDVLLIKIVNIDEDENNKPIDYFFAPRIFRKDKSIYYTGRIHEQLTKNKQLIEKMTAVPAECLYIYHTGYSAAKQEGKAQRNLNMLLAELQTESNPQRLYMYLAEAYDGVGDVENAIKYAHMDIRHGRQSTSYASRSYRILLRLLEQQNADPGLIQQTLTDAIRDFPEIPEFRAEYAQFLAAEFKYTAAISSMEEAVACYKAYNALEPIFFDEEACRLGEILIDEWKKMLQWQTQLKISACVIVKNEAAEISLWLDSIKQCSDEQIVVDTGSTDDTVAIVEAAGIKVYHYAWNNDFAAAKNFAIEKATGDWIVFLDADETFSPATIGNVRAVIAREHQRVQDVDAILCPIVNIDIDNDNIEISRFMNLRIFRNVPYLCYQGRVHECLYNKENALHILTEKNLLEVYHTGYSSQRIKAKLLRNLDLLQADIVEHGEGVQHYRYLADCYQGLGDHERAVKYAKLHIASSASSVGNESEVYRTLINSLVALKAKSTEILSYLSDAVKKFPCIPDFYAYFAMEYIRQGEFKQAKEYLLRALAVYEDKTIKTVDSSAFCYILSEAYSWLAEIYLREGDSREAQKNVALALSDNIYNVQAFRILYQLLKEKNTDDIFKAIGTYYELTEKNVRFILRMLEEIAIDEVYFYYAAILEKKWGGDISKTKKYRLLSEGKAGELYDQLLKTGARQMEGLLYLIFAAADFSLAQKVKTEIIRPFWHCVERYYGVRTMLNESDWDGYIALLPAILRSGDILVIQKFSCMAKDFSSECLFKVFASLCQQHYWPIARDLLDELMVSVPAQLRPEVFREGGICLYYTGELKLSAKYLSQAQLLGDKSEQTKAYLKWIQEKFDGESVEH